MADLKTAITILLALGVLGVVARIYHVASARPPADGQKRQEP